MVPDKLFYPGQEITTKTKINWANLDTNELLPGPKFGEIVRCLSYNHCKKGVWFIKVTKYEGNFDENCFAPVISDDQLEEMLNEIDELAIKHQEPIG